MTKKFCSEQEENEFRKYYEGLSKYLEKKGYIVESQRYENIINREKKQLNKEVNKK